MAAQLRRWAELVITWNQRMDLTAARSDEELVDLLIADAAVLAAHVDEGARESWLDVGSGAGAPGLALALMRPSLAVTLVEPKAKRVAFLRTVLGDVGRADVRVIRSRSQDLQACVADVAVSRATLPPAEWVAEGTRLARGRVWALLAQEEPPATAGWRKIYDISYTWPLTGVKRRAFGCSPAHGEGPQELGRDLQ